MKLGVFNSLCCVIQTFSFLELASHIFGLNVFKTLIENNNKSSGIKNKHNNFLIKKVEGGRFCKGTLNNKKISSFNLHCNHHRIIN
jgi:hypothetical protein